MNEAPKVFAPELSPAGSKKWIGRLVVAVVLGAAIWNFVVSLTVNLVVPSLARVMEADPQSPLYLGKGDVNIAPFFVSLLELCFAVIAALVVHFWAERKPKPVRKKSVSLAPSLAPATVLSIAPAAPTVAAAPSVVPPRQPSPAPTPAAIPPKPAKPPQPAVPSPAAQAPAPPAKPEKPPKPKKVYYNIVGERIEEDDE